MIAQDTLAGIGTRAEAIAELQRAQGATYEVRVVRTMMAEEPVRTVSNAVLAASYWREFITGSSWYDAEKEHFVVLNLNRRNRVLSFNMVSVGTATATLAHPREIFRSAIVAGACAIICLHNHPSGDPSPSAADIQLTRQVREAGAAVDIPVLDHVIVGETRHDPLGRGLYSFRDAGLL